jgi:tetratricopeptide (TPR) repeat protein
MERMIPPSTSGFLGDTIGDGIDRIEVIVGKIGLNSADQALSLLTEFDTASERIKALDDGDTKKALTTQIDSALAKLRKNAGPFLRDIGGAHVLKEAREAVQPSEDRTWWYLDEYLASNRKASIRRVAITGGVIILALVVLGVLYQAFLAPDPVVAERYSREQSAQEALIMGDLPDALTEVDAGLKVAPADPTLLVLRGVILEASGRQAEAQADFLAAADQVKEEEFYLLRAQAYIFANLPDKAFADAQQAIQLNPDSIQAYLYRGQAQESMLEYTSAMKDYEKAFSIADETGQGALAAMTRMRIAMLTQLMTSDVSSPDWLQTATPTP